MQINKQGLPRACGAAAAAAATGVDPKAPSPRGTLVEGVDKATSPNPKGPTLRSTPVGGIGKAASHNFDELIVVAEIRPSNGTSFSNKDKMSREELMGRTRASPRNTKMTTEWLVGRQFAQVTENDECYTCTFEFNHELHSWDYGWKSNRWSVDETHCFDIILYRPDIANSSNMMHQIKRISSDEFTIFSARHIKKNNCENGEGLSLPTRLTYAAATKDSDTSEFIKKKKIEVPVSVFDGTATAVGVAASCYSAFGSGVSSSSSTFSRTPKSEKSAIRSNRNSAVDDVSMYSRQYPTPGRSTQRQADRAKLQSSLGRSRTAAEDDESYMNGFDYDDSFGEDAGSSAVKALALAVTGALVELGSDSKSKKRGAPALLLSPSSTGVIKTPRLRKNGASPNDTPISAFVSRNDFTPAHITSSLNQPLMPTPSSVHGNSTPPSKLPHHDAMLLIQCAARTSTPSGEDSRERIESEKEKE